MVWGRVRARGVGPTPCQTLARDSLVVGHAGVVGLAPPYRLQESLLIGVNWSGFQSLPV